MSTGKRYWEITLGETKLHKWRNSGHVTFDMPDGATFKTGDVVGIEIDMDKVTIIWNPEHPPEGFKPMDPEESK